MTLTEIQREYDRVKSQDQDLNGTPDLLEDAVLPAPRPFTGAPFSITGTIEAEQVYFVGNRVVGGRHAELGGLWDLGNPRPFRLVFCGNSVSLISVFLRSDDYPSAVINAGGMAWANISGNTLLQGGHGIRWLNRATNAIVLKNDFSAASHRSIAYDGSAGHAGTIQILKNTLNRGTSYHLKMPVGDGNGLFLFKNTYTNSVVSDNLFMDSASSPVHVMH